MMGQLSNVEDRRGRVETAAAVSSGLQSQCTGRLPAIGRVMTKCLLRLGLYGSMTSIVLMVDELVRTRFADPDDCKGAALMSAVMLAIAFLCRLGLRHQRVRPL
jgi:hypothetical protein